MFFDYYYIVLVLPMVLLAFGAQLLVKSSYSKYSKVRNKRGITGAEAAETVLRENGVHGVRVERVRGELSDHYDPKADVIRLSEGVYSGTSVAAVGIACHEAGHALQYHKEYSPIKLRMAMIPVCNAASTLSFPLVLIGIIFSYHPIAVLGVAAFAVATLFQLITLPVEFNASKRAVETVRSSGLLYGDEINGAKKVLTAAALTYVAALAVSLANLLRLFFIVGGRNRD